MLMTSSPTRTQTNMASRSHHFYTACLKCLTPISPNSPFTNHTYQTTQTRGHTCHTAPFRMTNTSHEQQGFYHRGPARLDGLLHGTSPCEYYNHGLHNTNITTYHLETIPFGQARGTIYEDSLFSSVMIEQTIIQAALSSVETFDGTKANLKLGWSQ